MRPIPKDGTVLGFGQGPGLGYDAMRLGGTEGRRVGRRCVVVLGGYVGGCLLGIGGLARRYVDGTGEIVARTVILRFELWVCLAWLGLGDGESEM